MGWVGVISVTVVPLFHQPNSLLGQGRFATEVALGGGLLRWGDGLDGLRCGEVVLQELKTALHTVHDAVVGNVVVLVDAFSDVEGLVGVLMKGTVAVSLHLGTLVLEEGRQVVDLLGMEGTEGLESLQKLLFTVGW